MVSAIPIILWAIAIAIAQLRLSPLEQPWSGRFWIFLISTGVAYFLGLTITYLFENLSFKIFSKFKIQNSKLSPSGVLWFLLILFTLTILGNFMVWLKVGNFPLTSSNPEQFRFFLNREVWGLWEWLALLPRWGVPIAIWLIVRLLVTNKWAKIMAWGTVVVGVFVLSLYASRALLLFPLILSYVIVLMHERERGWKWQRVGWISCIFGLLAAVIFFLIPALRYLISFAVLYGDENIFSLEYIIQLTQIQIPHALRLFVLPYLALSFNLQALSRLVVYYGEVMPHAFGGMLATVFDPMLPWTVGYSVATVPWREIFQFWWVTATGLAQPFIDFGIAGVLFVVFLWGFIVRHVELWAKQAGSANLVANLVLGFIVVASLLSIYTNIFYRRETYLDLAFILTLCLASRYTLSPGTVKNLSRIA